MRSFAACIAVLFALTFAQPSAAQRAENRSGEFDYYALVLNWSPSYCADRGGGRGQGRQGEPQCSGDRPYSFILHGLWPQYNRGWPQDCRTQERPWVPEDLIRQMLDVMPSKRLIIHEYRKHGTCSGLSPADYFRVARQLFEQIKIPPRFQNPEGYLTLSPAEVESEFLTANRQLKPDMISIACKGRNLGDLRICFGRDLQLQSCGVNETQQKLCSSEKIVMPPVRQGSASNSGHGDDPNEANGEDRNQGQNDNDDQGEGQD
jgi:ribonuclease T2